MNLVLSFQGNGYEMGSRLPGGPVSFRIKTSDPDGEVFTRVQVIRDLTVVFDMPVTSIRFRANLSEGSATHGIDDLEAFTVPEPASLALLGLGGLALLKRKRKSATGGLLRRVTDR